MNKDKKLPAQNPIGKRGMSGLWIDFKRLKLDGRTALSKAMNKSRLALIKHCGGSPSVSELILIDRAVHKVFKAYIYETNYLAGEPLGSRDHYLALVNSLRHDLITLGIQPKEAKKIIDLKSYLKEKSQKETEQNG